MRHETMNYVHCLKLWSSSTQKQAVLWYCVWEDPLMTSDVRVGRGVQNDLKIGHFRVKKGR